MSPAAKFEIMIASAVLALAWVTYSGLRRQAISSARFRDQFGMAAALLATSIYISNFSGLFSD